MREWDSITQAQVQRDHRAIAAVFLVVAVVMAIVTMLDALGLIAL